MGEKLSVNSIILRAGIALTFVLMVKVNPCTPIFFTISSSVCEFLKQALPCFWNLHPYYIIVE